MEKKNSSFYTIKSTISKGKLFPIKSFNSFAGFYPAQAQVARYTEKTNDTIIMQHFYSVN